VVIRASQSGDSVFAPAADVIRSFTVLDSYGTWANTRFSSDQLANPTVSDRSADPDLDGLSNLVEYALGFDPLTADHGTTLSVSRNAGSWVVTYARPANRADLIYSVETSADLSTWSTSLVTHTLVSTSGDGSTQTWQAVLPASEKAFFRLKITTAN